MGKHVSPEGPADQAFCPKIFVVLKITDPQVGAAHPVSLMWRSLCLVYMGNIVSNLIYTLNPVVVF